MEELWKQIIIPYLQLRQAPFIAPEIKRAEHPFTLSLCKVEREAPDELFPKGEKPTGEFHSVEGNKLFGNINFVDSKTNNGIQLVDIVTTGFRRFISGKMGISGVMKLGRLTVRRMNGGRISSYTISLFDPEYQVHSMTMARRYTRHIDYLSRRTRSGAIPFPDAKDLNAADGSAAEIIRKSGTLLN